jgi:hypothetical protein
LAATSTPRATASTSPSRRTLVGAALRRVGDSGATKSAIADDTADNVVGRTGGRGSGLAGPVARPRRQSPRRGASQLEDHVEPVTNGLALDDLAVHHTEVVDEQQVQLPARPDDRAQWCREVVLMGPLEPPVT